MNILQMHALAGLGVDMSPTRGDGYAQPFPSAQNRLPQPPSSASTPSTAHAQAETRIDTRSSHVMSQRSAHHGPPDPMHGLAQAMAEMHFNSYKTRREIAIPSYKRGVGDSETLTPGDYHISGTQVQLRTLPSAKSAVKGVLVNGEGVYVFGDLETDPEFMLGPNNEAVPNDGSDPGLIYARVGTQTHGAGWVAAYFLATGAGSQTQPVPIPVPVPVPVPTPTPATPPKSYLVPVLVGGAIGATVLLGGALIYRASKKSRRTPTRRMPAYA